jgi:sugar/nucleoside kinase (ribokinase family)
MQIGKELQKLLTKNTKTHVIITRGADPIILASNETDIQSFTVKRPSHIVDTIGCGDAFVGGRIIIIFIHKFILFRFSRLSIIE